MGCSEIMEVLIVREVAVAVLDHWLWFSTGIVLWCLSSVLGALVLGPVIRKHVS